MDKEENKKISLEETFALLEQMIEKLSDKDTPLEEAFETYRKGMQIVKEAQNEIDLVEKQVMILNEEGGNDEF